MDEKNKQLLDQILKYAAERKIQIPADIVLKLSTIYAEDLYSELKQGQAPSEMEGKILMGTLRKLVEQIVLEEVPEFGLMNSGLVPAPGKAGLMLMSTGWKPYLMPSAPGGGGGGTGISDAPGDSQSYVRYNRTWIVMPPGVTQHNLLTNLDYASAGHTGFEPADPTILKSGNANWVDLTDGGATVLHSHAPDHAAVTLDVNADTILALAGQALGLDTQVAGRVLAGPTSGAAAVPTFRALAATDIPTIAPEGTYLVSGGGVTWKSDYIYTVAAGTGYINGVLYSWAQQDITLDAANALLDRIDMIGIDSTSTVFKVTGDAAADPSEPVVDPSTQLELAFVLVTANTTEPVGITSELIYAENAGSPTEWAWTTSGVGFNVNSATNPRTGATDIEGTNVAANAYALATRGAGTIDPSDYTQLVFYIRFKASWNASRYLQIQLQNAGVKKGNALRISNGQFGLVGTNTTDYQAVIIPVLQFAVPTGTLINQVRIIDVGGAIGFYIDDVSITTGGAGGTFVTGMTQDEADARYVQLTNGVTGPATNTDHFVPKWNGANSRVLEDGFEVVTTVDASGSDLKLASEQAIREAIKAIIWPVTKTVSNPQAVYTQRPQIVLFQAPAALTITRIHIHGSDTSPTAELAGDLKWADDVNTGGFANAAVIDVCDTTNGVFTATGSFDDATIASGKYVYFQMDASPHADWVDFYIEVRYTLD